MPKLILILTTLLATLLAPVVSPMVAAPALLIASHKAGILIPTAKALFGTIALVFIILGAFIC